MVKHNSLSQAIPLISAPRLQKLAQQFSTEIKQGLRGKKSSLPCIQHTINAPQMLDNAGYSLVVGGSNGASAAWQMKQGKIILHDIKHFRVPRYISNQFLQSMIEQCVDKKHGNIGLNFAYGLNPIMRNGVLDGILSGNSKEARFNKQFIGKKVGVILERLFKKNGNKNGAIAVANDTICLLLAAYSFKRTAKDRPVLVGIVGTGVNFAFLSSQQQIKTIIQQKGKTDTIGGYAAVNIESGHFTAIPQTSWDIKIDRGSSKPGGFLAEKQIAGAYLHHVYNAVAQHYDAPTLNEAADIDWVAQDASHQGYMLANSILERSAQLTAMEIVGIVRFFSIDSGEIPILMEGSLFWKGYRYKQRVQKWLNILLPNVTVKFKKLSNSSLIGGAMLALTIPSTA